MSREDALLIAHAFVMQRLGHLPECDGSQYEGNPGAAWTFYYRIPVPAGTVMDPSHSIVIVDVATKTARFLTAM